MNSLIKLVSAAMLILMTALPTYAKQIEIITIYNERNVGDQNQVKGIKDSLVKLLSTKPTIREYKNTELDALKASFANNQEIIQVIIASGEPGIKAYEEITPNIQNKEKFLLTVYTSHQVIDGYKNILGIVKFWVLPQHAIKKEVTQLANNKNTTIIPIVGVPHDLTRIELEKEFNKYKNYFENIKGKFIIVILGGDAPNEKGEVKYYTATEAAKLGEYIGKFAKNNNLSVLVFNGPRTGQHNVDKKIDEKAHKNEKDHVTKAFEERILANLSKDKLFLYNFIKGYPPLYKAGLGFALQKNMSVFVPGESTSTISEVVDNFPVSRVFIVKNNAMNNIHSKHVESLLNMNKAKLFSYNDINLDEEISSINQHNQSAAEIVAQKIYDDLEKSYKLKE